MNAYSCAEIYKLLSGVNSYERDGVVFFIENGNGNNRQNRKKYPHFAFYSGEIIVFLSFLSKKHLYDTSSNSIIMIYSNIWYFLRK